jgi:succinate dehydrogenase flavin-adding protein (antitoxin of CptAB toxin-antitoxin module)
MYRFLSKDQSAPESFEQRQVDQRVFKCLLEADDPDLLYDLRKNNGNPECAELEPFWQEVDRFLEEQAIVHERRHGDYLSMPFAISLSDLRNHITARLPGDDRLPTLSTIRYNFWPPNPS